MTMTLTLRRGLARTWRAAGLAGLLALAGATPPASAATTNIAQLPLLNIDGTGSVKPNLMLLFDNSGSMLQAYTPDFVNDSICRGRALLSTSSRGCIYGMPPYMAADFNKQYYNPKILYTPPIKADGSYYASMTSANSDSWRAVLTDGFGITNVDLTGAAQTQINLTSAFPDLWWCSSTNSDNCTGANLRANTASYTYPDDTYYNAYQKTGAPYYYNIGVGEYCRDKTLTVCVTTAIGAAAPAGYPVAAQVRYCNSRALTTCQAKANGSYTYPRFSGTGATPAAYYATITIGASNATTNSALSITGVTVGESGGVVTITNAAATATAGTGTAAKQQALADALAASIIAKTGLVNQYMACVNVPASGSAVPACLATYGFSLASNSMLAIIPVVCGATKLVSTCATLTDNSRAGWAVTATSSSVNSINYKPPTSLLNFSGTGNTSNNANNRTVVTAVKYNGDTIVSNLTLVQSATAANAVSAIVTAFNASGSRGSVIAYIGGNSVTTVCANKNSASVCLVDTTGGANGVVPAVTLTNANTLAAVAVNGAGWVAGSADTIPTSSATFGALAFSRVDIVPTRAYYPRVTERRDCTTASGFCTYAEEMTNFANWYTYYRTRLQMMKTAVGLSFAPLTQQYRVGFFKLSTAGVSGTTTTTTKVNGRNVTTTTENNTGAVDIPITDFNATARAAWYSALYNTDASGSTPLRVALHNTGRMFSGLHPYENPASAVVTYPCQQNFTILTTDGYWNGGVADDVVSNDQSESASRFCTYGSGCVDSRTQAPQSLADIALYWYNGGSNTGTVSLRPSLEPDMTKTGSVSASAGENSHLHMNTFTLGLGVDGIMNYDPNYDNAGIVTGGDFYNLLQRTASGCSWNNNGAYVWPDPDVGNTGNTVQARVDDLWHTAIAGHGKYFSTSNPTDVVAGLGEAITKLQQKSGAAAAAATSTPNISLEDRDIFSATFTTVKWYGEVADRYIDTVSGEVGTAVAWNTSTQVGRQVAAAADSRTIYMYNTAGTTLKQFLYANMTPALEQTWFNNKCAVLSQCTLLTADNKIIANGGANLVNWLRGQQQYADDTIFRAYFTPAPEGGVTPPPIVLGDIASAKPAYLYDARKSYTTTGYADFKVASLTRVRTLFAAANDGMLHAFYAPQPADTLAHPERIGGKEIWAYAPRITMKKLAVQASLTYASNHQFTVDGSPELGDVQNSAGAWKTVLVAGLNGGGRGYYALDVTDPTAPVQLWELCADAAICSRQDNDIGLTFGNAQFGKWMGKWVVFLTSGYNNVPGSDGVNVGSGIGYLYIVDAMTGEVLKKVATGSGSVETPSGLAKITSISANPAADPVATYIYGGDVLGQMWRFDLTDTTNGTVAVVKMGDAGSGQPITARPDVTTCAIDTTTDSGVTSTVGRVVAFGTGRMLDVPDVTDVTVQSLYVLKDSGSTVAAVRGSTMEQQTLTRVPETGNYTIAGTAPDLSTKAGWYLNWDKNAGERMNLDPKIVSGALNVVTNVPSSTSTCNVGGTSNVYQLNVCTGAVVRSDNLAGSQLSNTSAAVGYIIIRLPSGAYKLVATLADGSMLTSSLTVPGTQDAHKVGWRRISN